MAVSVHPKAVKAAKHEDLAAKAERWWDEEDAWSAKAISSAKNTPMKVMKAMKAMKAKKAMKAMKAKKAMKANADRVEKAPLAKSGR